MFRPFTTAKVSPPPTPSLPSHSPTSQGAYFSFFLFFTAWIVFVCALSLGYTDQLITASGSVRTIPSFRPSHLPPHPPPFLA